LGTGDGSHKLVKSSAQIFVASIAESATCNPSPIACNFPDFGTIDSWQKISKPGWLLPTPYFLFPPKKPFHTPEGYGRV
jgi:hypothetical protein